MNSSMVICAGGDAVLQGLMSAARQWLAVVSLSLVAGESLRRSRSWLLVMCVQSWEKGAALCGSLFRVHLSPSYVLLQGVVKSKGQRSHASCSAYVLLAVLGMKG